MNSHFMASAALMLVLSLGACSSEPSRDAPVDGEASQEKALEAETTDKVRENTEVRQDAATDVVRVVYLCSNGQRLTVDFDKPRQMATVRDSNGLAVDLHQEPAALGIWYTTGGHDLRGEGNEVIWKSGDRPQTTCETTA